MNQKTKIIIGVVVAVAIIVGASFFFTGGGQFQGRIQRFDSIKTTNPTVTLDAPEIQECFSSGIVLYSTTTTGQYQTYDAFKKAIQAIEEDGNSCPWVAEMKIASASTYAGGTMNYTCEEDHDQYVMPTQIFCRTYENGKYKGVALNDPASYANANPAFYYDDGTDTEIFFQELTISAK